MTQVRERISSLRCPLTGKQISHARFINIGAYEIAYVKDTSLWTTINIPENIELERAYQSFGAGVLSRRNFDEYLEQSISILKRELQLCAISDEQYDKLSFLDYGCGGAHFVAAAQKLGIYAVGMELDAESVKLACNKGLDVRQGMLPRDRSRIVNDTFDVIKLSHVLEHVPNPHELIKALLSVLKIDGVLIISVPDQDSLPSRLKILLRNIGIKLHEYGFVQPPVHLHGFTDKSFVDLASSESLDLVFMEKYSPLDRCRFPTTNAYWSGASVQRLVYSVAKMFGSGGYLTIALRKSC